MKNIIKYSDIVWIVLEQFNFGTLVISKDILYEYQFDNQDKNNWSSSVLRKKLSHLINDKNNLVLYERDLKTVDNLIDYGKCGDCISLLSYNDYKRYKNIIPPVENDWWLLTGDGLVFGYSVCIVRKDGKIDGSAAYNSKIGVRPICVIKELC